MDDKKLTSRLLLLLICTFPLRLAAQELLFEQIPEVQSSNTTYGPNQRNFCHGFASYALFSPSTKAHTIKTNGLQSGALSFGIRYKYHASKPIALIAECGLNLNFFKIKQSSDKSYPDTLIHQAQFIRSDQWFTGVYIRWRLGQNGDYLGNYIDAGMEMEAPFWTREVNTDWIYSDNQMERHAVRTAISEFNSFEPFNYHAVLRVGLDRVSLVLSYRLSHLLVSSVPADLPPLKFGVELSLVRY